MDSICTHPVVDSGLINDVKLGLIRLGYVNDTVPNILVRDCYVAYAMIRQTGMFEASDTPFAINVLPKSIQDSMLLGSSAYSETLSLTIGDVLMSEQCELVVPATLLNQIKTGLIELGYASEATPLTVIQDCYYRYVVVRQTGAVTNIPYAACFLPTEIQDILNPPTAGVYFALASTEALNELHNGIKNGTIVRDWINPIDLLPDNELILTNDGDLGAFNQVTVRTLATNVQNDGGGEYTLINVKKFIISMCLEGLTDAEVAKMAAGTSEIEIYQETTVGVFDTLIPNTQVAQILYKHTDNKYYFFADRTTIGKEATTNPLLRLGIKQNATSEIQTIDPIQTVYSAMEVV